MTGRIADACLFLLWLDLLPAAFEVMQRLAEATTECAVGLRLTIPLWAPDKDEAGVGPASLYA
jgi:hypothetical protein